MDDEKDRRIYHRYKLWIPARLEGETGPTQLAVGHDMSQKGSLLVTSKQLQVGERVRLFVRIPPDADDELQFEARVLRIAANDADPNGLWPFRVALEFDQAVPELEKALRQNLDCLDGLFDTGEQPP